MAGNGAETRRAIYRTALILTGLTVVEFIIAFTKKYYAEWMGISEDTAQSIVVATFVILTIFKAFYIVAEFMHLRHEVKRMAWTILVPFIFIVWLIIGLISEGTYWGKQASSDKTGSQNSEMVWFG